MNTWLIRGVTTAGFATVGWFLAAAPAQADAPDNPNPTAVAGSALRTAGQPPLIRLRVAGTADAQPRGPRARAAATLGVTGRASGTATGLPANAGVRAGIRVGVATTAARVDTRPARTSAPRQATGAVDARVRVAPVLDARVRAGQLPTTGAVGARAVDARVRVAGNPAVRVRVAVAGHAPADQLRPAASTGAGTVAADTVTSAAGAPGNARVRAAALVRSGGTRPGAARSALTARVCIRLGAGTCRPAPGNTASPATGPIAVAEADLTTGPTTTAPLLTAHVCVRLGAGSCRPAAGSTPNPTTGSPAAVSADLTAAVTAPAATLAAQLCLRLADGSCQLPPAADTAPSPTTGSTTAVTVGVAAAVPPPAGTGGTLAAAVDIQTGTGTGTGSATPGDGSNGGPAGNNGTGNNGTGNNGTGNNGTGNNGPGATPGTGGNGGSTGNGGGPTGNTGGPAGAGTGRAGSIGRTLVRQGSLVPVGGGVASGQRASSVLGAGAGIVRAAGVVTSAGRTAGAYQFLPRTGADGRWLFAAGLCLLVLGLLLLGVGRRRA